jgi:hypothetical protein
MSGHMVGGAARAVTFCPRNAWSEHVRFAGMAANCKTVAKASVVRIHYPPQAVRTALDQHTRGRGRFPLLPAESSPGRRPCVRGCSGRV